MYLGLFFLYVLSSNDKGFWHKVCTILAPTRIRHTVVRNCNKTYVMLKVLKGQLISECLFDFSNFPKKHRKIWQISAQELKRCCNHQNKDNLSYYVRGAYNFHYSVIFVTEWWTISVGLRNRIFQRKKNKIIIFKKKIRW